MRFRVLLVALLCTTTSCGGSAEPPHHLSVVRQVDEKERQLAVTASALEQRAEFYERLNFVAWTTAARENAVRERDERKRHAVTGRTAAPLPPASCGGDLPPCYVAQRESGGSYTAYNPNGCGGNGCYGKWQFSGAWAGKLGLPADLSTATPAQQDAAARALWADGAGCSHWGAC